MFGPPGRLPQFGWCVDVLKDPEYIQERNHKFIQSSKTLAIFFKYKIGGYYANPSVHSTTAETKGVKEAKKKRGGGKKGRRWTRIRVNTGRRIVMPLSISAIGSCRPV